MKLQVGLLYRDGRLASTADLISVLGPYDDWNAETGGENREGSLALAYRGDRITWEEDTERQPLDHACCVLTFDGRLDNREELGARVDLMELRSTPDPVIVAKGYAKFGDSLFEDLIGEFALVLWCKRTKSLLFARSVCGSRPLYYVVDKDTVRWSSDFAHLVHSSGVDLAVNERYVLEYLVSQPYCRHSPLKHVNVVPPGTLVRFAKNEFQRPRRLWDPKHVRSLNYHSPEEYEEHCREVFSEAVRVRLRAKHPLFAELSGGLDSSSLVLTADEILRSQNLNIDKLKTVSCVYEESQTCDERPFIRAVEENRQCRSILLPEQQQQITLGLDDIDFSGVPSPLDCFPGRYRTMADLMRRHGARILVTGNGGDHLFWSEVDGTPLVADELYKGHIVRMHKACATWSRLMRLPYLQLLLTAALSTAPRPIALRFQYPPILIPRWIDPSFKQKASFLLRDSIASESTSGPPSRQAQIKITENLLSQIAAGFFCQYRELYFTHPFTHRPLIEFCLGVPLSQLLLNAQPRSLMRRSFRNLLPYKIRTRASKGLIDESLARAVQREWASIGDLRRWELCRRGIVQPRLLSDSLSKVRLGRQLTNEHLVRAFSMERWLRSLNQLTKRHPDIGTFASTKSPI